jgi:hypothetical protein
MLTETPVVLALIAFGYAVVLTDEEMILQPASNWLSERLPWWLWKPIIGCPVCVSGQLALWWTVFNFESVWQSVFNICATLTITSFATRIYERITY